MKNDIGNTNAGSVGTVGLPYFSFTFILRVMVQFQDVRLQSGQCLYPRSQPRVCVIDCEISTRDRLNETSGRPIH